MGWPRRVAGATVESSMGVRDPCRERHNRTQRYGIPAQL